MYNKWKSAVMVNKKTRRNLHNKYLIEIGFGKCVNIHFSSKILLRGNAIERKSLGKGTTQCFPFC